MQTISRQDAIAQGLKRYYTGVPCKNGHLTERYVYTCGCIGCLRPAAPTNIVAGYQQTISAMETRIEDCRRTIALMEQKIEEANSAAAHRTQYAQQLQVTRAARAAARSRMTRLRVGLQFEDVPLFVDTILALSQLREPALTREDIETRFRPRPSGMGDYVHEFWIYVEDRPGLLALKQDFDYQRMDPAAQARIKAAMHLRR